MLKKLAEEYKILLSITPLYFLFRIFFLTKLPIFNDEAIYLDWGWRATHLPGAAYLALTDGKQPLEIWLFGIVQNFVSNPLFAGRLLSVGIGLCTFIGIFLLAKHMLSERFAALASVLYALIPLFVFFDRQALMESAVAAVGVWSLYLLLSLLRQHSYRDVLLLGAVLGVGFFVKSTVLIFVIITLVFLILSFVSRKTQNTHAWKDIPLAILCSQLVLLPLYLQKTYWETLSMNARYSLGFWELIRLPIHQWMSNLFSFAQISFWHVTPLLFCLLILGVVGTLYRHTRYSLAILLWLLGTSGLFLIVARDVTVRYTEPFLPLTTIFIAAAISWFYTKRKLLTEVIAGASMLVAGIFTIFLIGTPLTYFSLLSKGTNTSQQSEYVSSWTSGYAVTSAKEYLDHTLTEKHNIIATALETGNPQNAVATYFHDNPSVILAYLDSHMFASDINQFDCLSSAIPLYFISRENQIAGLDKFLVLEKTFPQPMGNSFVGVYTLKKTCTGKTLDITPTN